MATMLTPVEGFRYGVLLRCAEEGLDAAATEARIQKIASMQKVANLGGMAGSAFNAAKALGWTGVLGSMAAGGLTGYGAAKMQEGDVDADDYRKQDVIAALRAQTQQMRERAARLRVYRQAPKAPRLFQA